HDGTVDHWATWLRAQGVATSEPLKGMICEDGMLARSAILAGIGIALIRPLLIERELAAGSLTVVSDHGLGDG
ncbi:LysR substrate-binding domain-containing protein, partial [Stenotrophomonas maltophilia]|uniref:LysR substrate-binding domain-containing protein n=1 Tax=Stenotrophomonas maltophilia TaxID=40324 RepID=UPI003CCFEC77